MLLERFIRYVKIDTQSDDYSSATPTTEKQFNLLNLLKSELDELNVQNELTKTGRLYAFIPGGEELDAIGVCAHVDTAPDFSGTNVNPQVIEKYDGKVILLGKSGRFLDPREYEVLNHLVGKTLITTDGTTLLGADDKAGVSIIMEVILEVLKLNKNISEVEYGTRWLKEKKSLMLKVQSAVLPYEYEHEFNLIINPLHPDFHKIFVAEVHSFSFDKRFD